MAPSHFCAPAGGATARSIAMNDNEKRFGFVEDNVSELPERPGIGQILESFWIERALVVRQSYVGI
jgi:hypothetical protein